MGELLLVAMAGFAAAMVDGALGMGFGPTSSTLLLSTGLPPAAVSATVNLAKVASGLAAAGSHWRFGNVDRRLVRQLAVPGCLGALLGVTVLNNVDGEALRPMLAAMLVVVGLRMLLRFSAAPTARVAGDADEADRNDVPAFDERGLTAAAATGGVTNGLVGAWGPVVTPFLLHKGLPPRFAIGSVNTAEVAVAAVAAGSLLGSTGGSGLDVGSVLAMMAGGVVAAPLAAWVIRFVPARVMGLGVAGLLLLTNVREVAGWLDLSTLRWVGYGTVLALLAAASAAPRLRASGGLDPAST